MKTYIIHFDKLKERKIKLENQLKKYKNLEVEWFIQKGHYSKEIIDKYYKYDLQKWKEKTRIANRIIIPRPLSKSEIHLSINHFKLIGEITKGKNPYVLILEDDAIFTKNFENNLEKVLSKLKNNSWDIIFLDWLSDDYSRVKQLTILEERGKYDCYGAAAYIIKKEACEKIVCLNEKITLPADEELKYRINKLGLKVLWIVPPLVRQESIYGKTEKSGQDQRERLGIKKYIFWRTKIYSFLPTKVERFFYNQEDKIKRIILGIKDNG